MCIARMKKAAESNQVVAQVQCSSFEAVKFYFSCKLILLINLICTICKIATRETSLVMNRKAMKCKILDNNIAGDKSGMKRKRVFVRLVFV